MKDPTLLSSILPNVFDIASTLDAAQFSAVVLPSLKPLFSTKDPPIVMMVLLENLETLQSKTSKAVFRTGRSNVYLSSAALNFGVRCTAAGLLCA